MRCTCDVCGAVEESKGERGDHVPKGWGIVRINRHPALRFEEATLCAGCIKPVLKAAKLKLPKDGG